MNTSHPRVAFGYRDFRFYASARFLSLCAHQMLVVAISQHIYELTHDPLYLGYIGLALFIPKISFTLFAGHTADRFDRRDVILVCRLLQWIAVMGLIACLLVAPQSIAMIYLLLVALGIAYTFDGPASQALVPQLVLPHHFNNAVAWNSSIMQIAFIAGPAIGGAIYALSGRALEVLSTIALMRFVSALLVHRIAPYPGQAERRQLSFHVLFAGVRYVMHERLLLGIISLDLFAVLLGGAVALMPVFANDILHVGPSGLGVLRAAPAIGAAATAIALAHLPPLRRAGPTLFVCVAIFGIATIGFGLSRYFMLSILLLIVLGAADMVSVVIRGILVQIKTPPEMRGRVSAVNLVFIGASNELGEFESGLTASWFGVVPAVIIGGIGTLVVIALWTWKFPEIRRYGALSPP